MWWFKIYKGDVGNELIFTIKNEATNEVVNLTNATSVKLIMKYQRIKVEKNCVILEPKTDGKVMYTIEENDLPVSYTYRFQIVVTFSDGDVFHSNIISEKVEDILWIFLNPNMFINDN